MDMTTPQIVAATVGSSGLTGTAVQLLALYREKRGWRAEMEARLKKVESESPSALLRRIDEVEGVREADKREMYRIVEGLRTALRSALDSLAEVQTRLKIPIV